MNFDIQKYRGAIRPASIFDLVPRAIVEQMIRGFFYRVRRGVTLRHTEYDQAQRRWIVVDDALDAFNYRDREDREFCNKVCWHHRCECAGEGKCRGYDKEVAQRYVDGEVAEIRLYPCWLGMDDLAYPLKIGDCVRAVLFTGQIVPTDPVRVKAIEDTIENDIPSDHRETLLGYLREEQQQQPPDYATTLEEQFREFGKMMEEIFDLVYQAKKDAVTRELLQRTEDELAAKDLASPTDWWSRCEALLASFSDLIELTEIQAYARKRHHYESCLSVPVSCRPIAVRDVLSCLDTGSLHCGTENQRVQRLAESLNLPPEGTRFFLSHAVAERTPLSTLLVLHGDLRSEYQTLALAFCRIVAQHADFSMLVEHLRTTQQEFRDTVAQVAHDFRTPLQVLMLDLQNVTRLDAVKRDAIILQDVNTSILRAKDAEEHVQHLLGATDRTRKVLPLNGLVQKVLSDLKPIAGEHPCRLRCIVQLPDDAMVRGVEYQLRRVFTNLVENAIKYSWCGKMHQGRERLHTVDVKMETWKNHHYCVSISNYGLGIPPETLDRIGEPAQRAEIADRRVREGSGWGLPIVLRILDEHNGWLEITSVPADGKPRAEHEQYHRYLTTVNVYLPMVR